LPTIKLSKPRAIVPTTRKREYQHIYQDKRWKRLRSAKMKNNPICERCEALGIVKVTDEVHHKIPFDNGKTFDEVEMLAFDYDNLESLCTECHQSVHK
jgi:5-methylcytosine-specific restriction enzyme A